MSAKKVVFKIVHLSFKILVILLVVLGIYKACVYTFDFGYSVFTEKAMEDSPGRDISVRIESKMSVQDIGEELVSKGLISNKNLFVVQELLSSYRGKLQAGQYTLNTSMTAKEMMKIIAAVEDEESKEEAKESKEKAKEEEK